MSKRKGREMTYIETPRMNPEPKAKRLVDLRSGEYVQTRGALCKKTADGSRSYCCLGVLTDQIIREDDSLEWRTPFGSVDLEFNGDPGVLVPYVRSLTGVTGPTGEIRILLPGMTDDDAPTGRNYHYGRSEAHTHGEGEWYIFMYLAELNDEGFTFDQIADIIEYVL